MSHFNTKHNILLFVFCYRWLKFFFWSKIKKRRKNDVFSTNVAWLGVRSKTCFSVVKLSSNIGIFEQSCQTEEGIFNQPFFTHIQYNKIPIFDTFTTMQINNKRKTETNCRVCCHIREKHSFALPARILRLALQSQFISPSVLR